MPSRADFDASVMCAADLVRDPDSEISSCLGVDFAPCGLLPLLQFVNRQDDLDTLLLQRTAEGLNASLRIGEPFCMGILEIRTDAFDLTPFIWPKPRNRDHRNV